MKYNTLEEIERDLINILPSNDFTTLTDIKKKAYGEKYIEIVLNVFNSIGFNCKFKLVDAEGLFDNYLNTAMNDMPYLDEMFESRSKVFSSENLPKIYDEILDGLNNGQIADEILCENINEISDIFSGDKPPLLHDFSMYEEIFSKIISQNKDLIRFYLGKDENKYEVMLKEGYITVDEIIEKINNLSVGLRLNIYKILLKIDYSEVINSNFCKDYIDEIVFFFILNNDCDNQTFKNLLGEIDDSKLEDVIKRVRDYYIDYLNIATINNLYDTGRMFSDEYDKFFSIMVKKDINNLKYYNGNTINRKYIDALFDSNYVIDEKFVRELNNLYSLKILNSDIYSKIFEKVLEKNSDMHYLYIGLDFKVYKIMLQNNINVNKRSLIAILIANDELSEDDIESIFNTLNVKPFNFRALKSYRGDVLKLFNSFEKLDYFLEMVGINRDLFIECAFGIEYNWLDSILEIIDRNEILDFVNIKNYFFKNIYQMDNKFAGILDIKNLIDLLKNYIRYPDLCKNLLNGNLSVEQINKLKVLFGNLDVIKNDNNEVINSIDDINNIEDYLFRNYQKIISDLLIINDLPIMKSLLSKILFNIIDIDLVQRKLDEYGDIKALRQLLFNNRYNPEITDDILDMMVYVSMMEDVADCYDIDKVKSILSKINENKDIYLLCQKCNMMFRDFDEKMDALYAREMRMNLTDLSFYPADILDKEMTDKYGIWTIDLTDRKYCLLEHVKSEKETVEELVQGKSSGDRLFISLSLGSHRNQRLYMCGKSIIFGYSRLADESFIKSSISNMGSNAILRHFSFEIDTEKLNSVERGALETSSAIKGNNSEVLCYREGLKADCIILPGGREPTLEELEIAKKYNLKFVKTQEFEKTIENPKEINDVIINSNNHQIGRNTDNSKFSIIKKLLHRTDKHNVKRIAIFTDSHGLFEPTLAILEDARRRGINEIYSLGDNIGTGPNPKEVMDLLDMYGVKSLKGNHELYVTAGVDALKKHLIHTGSYASSLRNSNWTRSQLTKEQIEKIKSFPDKMIIEIGGEKVMLSHYIKDYNSGERKEIPKGVDRVFQGHVHFEGRDGRINTVRGAGIGGTSEDASYVILTEKPLGGYYIDVIRVKYDSKSTHYDIIESNMSDDDKKKIENWVGGRLR